MSDPLIILVSIVLVALLLPCLGLLFVLLRWYAASVWRCICHPLTRYAVAWLLALGVANVSLDDAYYGFNDGRRRDGNFGHTTIDFGGQWIMGRMLVEGQGEHLYHREYQRRLVQRSFPRGDEAPDQSASDAEQLMSWLMGKDDPQAAETIGAYALLAAPLPQQNPNPLRAILSQAVMEEMWRPDPAYGVAGAVAPLATQDPFGQAGLAAHGLQAWPQDRQQRVEADHVGGPLYPPINSLFFYPLGLMQPIDGYHVNQVVNILLAFVAGLGIRQLAGGRIWWPVASAGVIAFPGFRGSVALGQNAALTLAILVWGWALIARGRPVCGGIVWGLLAFKPVWALAIFLVPLLSRRWRVCLAMVGTGAVLALITLPFVGGMKDVHGWIDWWNVGVRGVHVWIQWWNVGRDAAGLYNVDENWIFVSRDLLSIPRRWLLGFGAGASDVTREQEGWPATVIGWLLLVAVLELTVRLAALRKGQARAVTGPPAAFLFLGAWLTCYHFMYYDVLLAALPVFLLLTEPSRFLKPRLLAIRPLPEAQMRQGAADYYQPRVARGEPQLPPLLEVGHRHVWVLNSFTLTLIAVLLAVEHVLHHMGVQVYANAYCLTAWPVLKSIPVHQPIMLSTEIRGTPTDTICLIVLWLWCGWLWLRMPREESRLETPRPAGDRGRIDGNGPADAAELVQLGADVGRPHERLAD